MTAPGGAHPEADRLILEAAGRSRQLTADELQGVPEHVARAGFETSTTARVGSAGGEVRIDRPKGNCHPRWRDFVYPLDYGYLSGTRAMDGGRIDVWCGTLPERRVTGVILTIDLLKRDAELKRLVGCTPTEAAVALAAHDDGTHARLPLQRPERLF